MDSAQTDYSINSMMHVAKVDLDIEQLEQLPEFSPVSSGFIYELEESNVRVIVTGGKFLIYGSKSDESALNLFQNIIEMIENRGLEVNVIEFPDRRNLSITGDLDRYVPLEALAVCFNSWDLNSEYEPEQFPALILRLDDSNALFLLYASGKFVLQGLTDTNDIDPAIQRLNEFIVECIG